MTRFDPRLERAARATAYGLLGLLVTGVVAVGLLYPTRPVQSVIYDLVYLQLGPSEATETAILTHFLATGVVAISVPLLIGDYLSDRLANGRALAGGIAAMGGLLVAFLVVALAGLAAFLTALAVLAVAFVGVPAVLRYRYDVRSGGIPAFVGGVPVLLLLLLLVGFGLGWGWGYVVTAQQVPAGTVSGSAADFADAPALERDLFTPANCGTGTDGRRVCRLSLRGYEHERAAARFMARHGVRCPYQNAPSSGESDSFVARHDGAYYRITCTPHGD
ncbi:MAG: hypothetical protein ABEI80_03020 [Haloplanus sp.]